MLGLTRRRGTTGLALAAVCLLALAPTSVTPLFSFADARIVESSGLVAASTPGVVWTVNDSGADARVHAVDDDGCTRLDLVLDGVTVRDVEDLGRDTEGRLVVADVGDNGAVREAVFVHRVAEPAVPLDGPCPVTAPEVVGQVETTRVVLADGPEDVEALLVDARTGSLLFVTKGTSRAPRVLEVRDGVAEAVAMPDLPVAALVTGGATAPDGSGFVVRTYGQAFVFERLADLPSTFASWTRSVDLPPQPQGEAIAWVGTDEWLLSSEDPLGTAPPVLSVRVDLRPVEDPTATTSPAPTAVPTPTPPPPATTTSGTDAPDVADGVGPVLGANRRLGLVIALVGIVIAVVLRRRAGP